MASTSVRRSILPHLRRSITFDRRSSTLLPAIGRTRLGRDACPFSTGDGLNGVDLSSEESKRRLVNRLRYRSKQRGFLELDLVLGNWVEENIRALDEPRIRSLIDVLDLENPDLWKWLTGQEQPPDSIASNPVFSAVRKNVTDSLNHSNPKTRASPGQPWVRGWDDKRGLDGPKHGNQ